MTDRDISSAAQHESVVKEATNAPARQLTGPPWLGSIYQRRGIDLEWLTVAIVLAASALVFFGWRGLVSVMIAGAGALAGHLVVDGAVRLLARRRSRVPHLHALNLGLLLGAAMPVMQRWWLPAAVGGAVGLLAHVVGRSHRLRVHPVVLVLVLIWLAPIVMAPGAEGGGAPGWMLKMWEPIDAVLRPQRLIVGDVRDATAEASIVAWQSPFPPDAPDAIRRTDTGQLLLSQRFDMLQDRNQLVRRLSTGELAQLSEIFVGAHIDAAGASSRALLIFLGFYLMYRRLAFWPVAMTALVGALTTMFLMPVWQAEADRYVSVLSRLIELGPAASITFVSYVFFATPMTLMVMVLAPGATPMSRSGRLVYGLIIGAGGIAAMWWTGQPQAAMLALLAASLLSRPLDALQRSVFLK